jgi:hypothetical protein
MSDGSEIVPTRFKLEAKVDVDWDAEDVAQQLTGSQMVDLIAELDDHADDWYVTLLAYHHFKVQFDACDPELKALTVEELEGKMALELYQQAQVDAGSDL